MPDIFYPDLAMPVTVPTALCNLSHPHMYFLLFFQQLLAASTHIFAKQVVLSLHPAVVVFYRGAFSSLLYLLWLVAARRKFVRIERTDWIMLIALGLINMPMNQLMFVWGLRYTTAPNASLAYALSPVFVLMLSRIILGEKLSRMKLTGVAIAIVGTVVILAERGLNFHSDLFIGNTIELCASMSWSIYTVFGRKAAMKYGAVNTTAITMLVGFALYLPLFAALPVPLVPIEAISTGEWAGLLYLGVVTSGIGFAMWYFLLTKIEATKLSVFNNLQPVFTTLLAFVISSHVPSAVFVIGGCIVIAGIIITQRAN